MIRFGLAGTFSKPIVIEAPLRPPPHRLLAGFGARLEPATGTHDPLQARMLVLDSAGVRLVWVSCDVIGFSTRTDAELRAAIARRAGTSPDFVLVSCTHTHGGPLSMSFRGGTFAAAESDWLERIAESLSALAAALAADLRPAGVSVAGTTVRGLGYNRQDPSAPIDERGPTYTMADYAYNPAEYDLLRSIGQAVMHLADAPEQRRTLASLVEVYAGNLLWGNGNTRFNCVRSQFEHIARSPSARYASTAYIEALEQLAADLEKQFPERYRDARATLARDVEWLRSEHAARYASAD